MTIIRGTVVALRPSRKSDRRAVFEWLAESDVTSSMMGPPLFPELPPPTWDQFIDDYSPNFFDASTPEVESSYMIEVAERPVGQVNYEIRDEPVRYAELDVWLRSLADTGHGYGPDALVALTGHLFRTFGVGLFLIRPSARNPRAIRAYEKAGFVPVSMPIQEQIDMFGAPEYGDTVVMIKRVSGEAM